MLLGGLRVLFRGARVLLTLGMIALAMVFSSGTVRLGGVFVMFGSLVVLVFSHLSLVGCQLPVSNNPWILRIVPNVLEWVLKAWSRVSLNGAFANGQPVGTVGS